MKKIMMTCLFAIAAITASAQKFALIDMEYIMKNIPAYERANEQLNQVSKNSIQRRETCIRTIKMK